MPSVVVATLNVSFSDDASTGAEGLLKLEIDDREDGPNGGDTSFKPGEDVYYLLFKGDSVTLVSGGHIATAGGITSQGAATKSVDENITFSNSDSGSLGYPPDGAVTMKWIGKCYSISKTGEVAINTELPDIDDNGNLKMTKNVGGVLNAVYESTGTSYLLKGVPKDILEVLIIAIGTVE